MAVSIVVNVFASALNAAIYVGDGHSPLSAFFAVACGLIAIVSAIQDAAS